MTNRINRARRRASRKDRYEAHIPHSSWLTREPVANRTLIAPDDFWRRLGL